MVTIRTVKGTPEGEVIRTMKYASDEDFKTLQKTIKEKSRKFKTLGEIREGFMADVMKKLKKKKISTKKVAGIIEKAYEKGRPKYTKAAREKRYEILREKNRQLQLQLRRERQIQMEQLAQTQRSYYEQPFDDFAGYAEPRQVQYEEEMPVQQKPSFVQNMLHKLRPKPGVLQRISGAGAKPQTQKGNVNSAQIGMRYIAGDGSYIKAPSIMSAQQPTTQRLALLGGNSMGGHQPNILNAPKVSFFGGQVNQPKDNLKW
jgi:hypothetical protein